jgi:hypothetical protein
MIELPPPSPMLWLPPKPAIIEPLRIVHPRLAVLPGMMAAIAPGASTAFPVIEGSTTGANAGGTGAANYSAPLPASITAGELLLLFVSRWRRFRAHRHDAHQLVIAVQCNRRRQRAALLRIL